MTEHAGADFTHSICPDCVKKLYPEYYDQMYGPAAEGNARAK
jgi:hypothetical protein